MTSTTSKPSKQYSPSRTPEGRRRYYEANKASQQAKSAEWYRANRDHVKAKTEENRLKRQYGITAEERDELLVSQGSACAICKTYTPTARGWVIDHCHDTGTVRGVLCHNCNVLLGHAKENPATLAAAITYLGK